VKNADPKAHSLEASLLRHLKQEWKLPALQYKTPPKPITGGFETSILKIQLNDTPTNVPATLIVRIFKSYASLGIALRESIIQNAVAAVRIPAPRVFLTCSDSSILGGEFNIMEYLSGKPMIETQQDDHPEMLARTHIQLHKVDPAPIIKTLAVHGFDKERFSLQGRLASMQKHIAEAGYDWLKPGLAWLHKNKPVIGKLAICHGDFHPLNILIHENEISGVLDWGGFRISDPMLDVAATKTIGSILAPVLVPGAISSNYIKRYLSAYQARRPLDVHKLRYFEVVRMILGLIDGAKGQYAWKHKEIVTPIYNTLREYTGLKIDIPTYLYSSKKTEYST
jgi:aminoglycoside phosphotransferase (APT) family kinase protein